MTASVTTSATACSRTWPAGSRRCVRQRRAIARFGGDEFLVLCDDIEDRRHAVLVAERLSGGLTDPFRVEGHEIYVGASIGIALAGDRSVTPEALIRDADQAMYQAKRARSRYRVAEGGTSSVAAPQLHVENDLHRALEREELRLYYQPEVDLERRTIFGVEGLLRWQHPERGMLAPADFMPAAENTGLIVPIGEWVLSTACQQLARWRGEGLCTPELSMSVNLSLRQLCDEGLVDAVSSAIREAEHPAVGDLPRDHRGGRGRRRGQGRRAARGSEGLGREHQPGRLRRRCVLAQRARPLPAGHAQDRPLLRAAAGARACARSASSPRSSAWPTHSDCGPWPEGVETGEQLEQIARIGCDAAQGFYLSRPGAAALIGPGLLRSPMEAV